MLDVWYIECHESWRCILYWYFSWSCQNFYLLFLTMWFLVHSFTSRICLCQHHFLVSSAELSAFTCIFDIFLGSLKEIFVHLELRYLFYFWWSLGWTKFLRIELKGLTWTLTPSLCIILQMVSVTCFPYFPVLHIEHGIFY